MNLAATLIWCYGTSEGVKKSWDTRGRKIGKEELEKRAVEEFGTTDDPREAGYILADGRMLDFSGKKQGSSESGVRYMDHREVSGAYPDDADAPDFHDFMNTTGAIRFGLYNGSVQVDMPQAHQMTEAQKQAVKDSFPYAGESPSLIIDLVDERGSNLANEQEDDSGPEKLDGLYRKARRNAWTAAHR